MKNPPPTTTTSTPPPSTRSFNAAEQDDEVERSSADERSNLETIIGMRRERSLTAHLYEAGERKMTSSTYPNRSISNLSTSSYQHRPLLTASADPIRACSGGTRSSSPSSSSSSSKRRHLLAYILLVLTLTVQCCSSQHIVYRRTPWIRSRTSQDIPTFRGDENDNEGFYFVKMTYLENWGQDRDILLIGARNRIFMLDAHPATGSSVIKFKKRMDIPADSTSVEWCQKRITVNKCANYIREMYLMEDDTLLVCGTNSKSPKTHHFKPGDFDQEGAKLLTETCELETGCICGRGRKKSVSIRIRENGTSHFFAAGYDDGFNDRDWFLTESNKNIHTSKKQFNSPDYIKILEYGKKIFLFFLEDEVGYSADIKIRYGRVAQVCKDDSFNNVFSTFVKARLYCNVPQGGSRSIVYDELTAVSDVVQVVLRNGQPAVDVVFATFTSPKEWNLVKQTSAVCMYTMDQINTLFNEGDFLKEGSTATGTMYSYPSPQPADIERLTTCNYGSQTSSTTITWASNNFMMFNAIKPQFEAAVFVSESNVRINSIKVDTNAGFSSNLMLYLGTEQGLVLRVKPRCTERYPTSVFMEEMNFSDFGRGCKEDPSNCVVKAITLTPRNSTTEPSLVVAFADRIVFSNLATCSLHTNRTICEADPECGYDSSEGHCVQRTPDNREYLGQVRTIEGEVEVVNKTETPAGMIADLLDNYEPALTIKLDKTKSYTIDRKRGCLAEVKSALKDTFNTVIENHNNFCPMHYNYTKKLTHLSPLILHHIKMWHKLLLLEMKFDEEKDLKCIETADDDDNNDSNNNRNNNRNSRSTNGNRRRNQCARRASFTTPLAPSIWVSIKEMLKEEFNTGLTCITQSDGRNSVESSDKCSEYKCSHPNAEGNCRPVTCSYTTLRALIDLKAFFRLPFYATPCWKPFKRSVEVEKLSEVADPKRATSRKVMKISRGNLEMKVGPNKSFQMEYNPKEEEVTINFSYKITPRGKKNKTDVMRVQDVLNVLLDRVFNSVNVDGRRCLKKSKRRRSAARRQSNNVNSNERNLIEYCTKKIKVPAVDLWEPLINRATKRKTLSGQGDGATSPNTLTFISPDELREFLKVECDPENRDVDLLLRRFGAEERRIKVDSEHKFVIERDASHSRKWKMRFYGTIKPHHSLAEQPPSSNSLA